MNYTQEGLEAIQGKVISLEMSILMAAKQMIHAAKVSEVVEVTEEINRLNRDLNEYRTELLEYEKALKFQTFMSKRLTPEQEAERAEILAEQELIESGERSYAECVNNGWYTN